MTRFTEAVFLAALTVWSVGYAQTAPAIIEIVNASLPVRILAQSPADTDTDLQVICVFNSSPMNAFHGSLIETNNKLKGLLDRIRTPALFRGELGESFSSRRRAARSARTNC